MIDQEDELFMRCVQLDLKRYALEDTIQEILDYLLHTHITLEEFEEVQKIATERKDKDNEQKLCR